MGIDPGTACVGYGVVDCQPGEQFHCVATGIIRTEAKQSMGQRLAIIRQDMMSLLAEYRPDVLVVEAIFFFKNAKTLVPVSQARGVILEAAFSSGVSYAEYTPMQVKMNLTGFGKADKKQVQMSVARILAHDEIIKPDDAADAVAIAICHARSLVCV